MRKSLIFQYDNLVRFMTKMSLSSPTLTALVMLVSDNIDDLTKLDEQGFTADLEVSQQELATSLKMSKDLLKLLVSNFETIFKLSLTETNIKKLFLFKVAEYQFSKAIKSINSVGLSAFQPEIQNCAEMTEEQLKQNIAAIVAGTQLNTDTFAKLIDSQRPNFWVRNKTWIQIAPAFITILVLINIIIRDTKVVWGDLNKCGSFCCEPPTEEQSKQNRYDLLVTAFLVLVSMLVDNYLTQQKLIYLRKCKLTNRMDQEFEPLLINFSDNNNDKHILGTPSDELPELTNLLQQDNVTINQVAASIKGANNKQLAKNRFIFFANKNSLPFDYAAVESEIKSDIVSTNIV